jgi:hypothetical protein
MQNIRRHYFPANECTVITGLLPSGQFGAYRESEDEGHVRGFGHSRLSAIADLAEFVAKSDEEADTLFAEEAA